MLKVRHISLRRGPAAGRCRPFHPLWRDPPWPFSAHKCSRPEGSGRALLVDNKVTPASLGGHPAARRDGHGAGRLSVGRRRAGGNFGDEKLKSEGKSAPLASPRKICTKSRVEVPTVVSQRQRDGGLLYRECIFSGAAQATVLITLICGYCRLDGSACRAARCCLPVARLGEWKEVLRSGPWFLAERLLTGIPNYRGRRRDIGPQVSRLRDVPIESPPGCGKSSDMAFSGWRFGTESGVHLPRPVVRCVVNFARAMQSIKLLLQSILWNGPGDMCSQDVTPLSI